MQITRKTEEVSRELTRTIKALRELMDTVSPVIESVVASAERPWWDLFGWLFSRKRDFTVMIAGVATAEGMETLIARLESMKSLCDNYGATEVLVSHEDMYHIAASKILIERVTKRLDEVFQE